ncbi:MAG: glycosyl transferase [Candidatus Roseilinea sp.]|nr:MAG: glycosyl transferase [Candidatus Roseilinea sp.]
MTVPDVSIVVVNWNTRDLLLRCIRCVYDMCADLSLEVIVVDNASSDDSVLALQARFPHVHVIENHENVGFARANNQGVRASSAPYALLLNSDAFLTVGALQVMLDLIRREPRAALVGAQLRNADGSFQASHTPFPNLWREFLILSGLGRMLKGPWYPSRCDEVKKGPQIVDYVDGACMLVRRDAYLQLGGLDEGYFMYSEEVDLCLRLKQHGWQVWYQPAAQVVHLGGASSVSRRMEREREMYRSRLRFYRKHYGTFSASALKLQLLVLTVVKSVVHNVRRLATRGRSGRRTVPLRDILVL